MSRITLKNIKGFIQGNFRRVLNEMDFLPEHVKEQAIWRLEQVKEKSPECYILDICKMPCQCQISSKVFEDRSCSGEEVGKPCYPPMMSEQEWVIYKQK